jgi:plastocyanin
MFGFILLLIGISFLLVLASFFMNTYASTARNSFQTYALITNETNQMAENASIIIVPGSSSPSNSKFFVPNLINISVGTTVIWTNDDLTSYKTIEVEQLHTVTSGILQSRKIGTIFDSGFLGAGKSFTHIFDSPGTFDYFCMIHPFMTGKVIVG